MDDKKFKRMARDAAQFYSECLGKEPEMREDLEVIIASRLNELQVQLLRQTDVSGCKELLIQMLKNENEALGKATFSELYKRETHANNKYCLAIVLQLIDERKACKERKQECCCLDWQKKKWCDDECHT